MLNSIRITNEEMGYKEKPNVTYRKSQIMLSQNSNYHLINRLTTTSNRHLLLVVATLISTLTICAHLQVTLTAAAAEQPQLHRPLLRPGRTSRAQPQPQQQKPQSSTSSPTPAVVTPPPPSSSAPAASGSGSAQEISLPANTPPIAVGPLASAAVVPAAVAAAAGSSAPVSVANRTTRTADIFQNGDGYNLFVTTACERESMKVNIKTSRPFYGIIHTRNQREKPICRIEGTGDTDYSLELSSILNSQDPQYCGVIKARRDSPRDKDVLSVVVAVRFHRTIELPDDKFFLLNCTNRCRRPDCSSPNASTNAKLFDPDDSISSGSRPNGPLTETEDVSPNGESGANNNNRVSNPDECTIWKFPWVITLLWCMGILLLAMIISHCIMCSSLVCRCFRTEVEEREPSVYEANTDDYDEDDLYNKRHPYRIDYDNRDIYKTSNNYAPYTLEETQTKSTNRQKHRK